MRAGFSVTPTPTVDRDVSNQEPVYARAYASAFAGTIVGFSKLKRDLTETVNSVATVQLSQIENVSTTEMTLVETVKWNSNIKLVRNCDGNPARSWAPGCQVPDCCREIPDKPFYQVRS